METLSIEDRIQLALQFHDDHPEVSWRSVASKFKVSRIMEMHSHWGGLAVNKDNFLEFYQTARRKALTQINIISAWAAAGIIPHNPQVILDKLNPTPRPITSSTITLTDSSEVTVQVPAITPQISKEIDSLII